MIIKAKTENGLYIFDESNKFLRNNFDTKEGEKKIKNISRGRNIIINKDIIENNFNNTSQIIFEITENCNLACSYCALRDNYIKNNFDDRNQNMSWEVAKTVIDYYISLWNKNKTRLKKNFIIGFYGGEPLLNFGLLKKVCEYTLKFKPAWLDVRFSITTNGLLLSKHIDYLKDNNFIISISMDGDEDGSSYRVDKYGKRSFYKLFGTLKEINIKYPEFFSTNIMIQSVLNDRSSVASINKFFIDEFKINPSIIEISTAYLSPSSNIKKMYKSYSESLSETCKNNSHDFKKYSLKDPDETEVEFFLKIFTPFFYHRYVDFLSIGKRREISNATCLPFFDRVFINARGMMMPCEKIGSEKPLGVIKNKRIKIDYVYIARFYSRIFNKYQKQCAICLLKDTCIHCFYNDLDFYKKDTTCNKFKSMDNFEEYLKKFLYILENKPTIYQNLIGYNKD